MESPLIVLVFGIALGVLLTVRSLKEVASELHERAPLAFPYAVLGFLLFAATWALQWTGFTVVITTFVLYHVVGKGKIPIPKLGWKRKSTPQRETQRSLRQVILDILTEYGGPLPAVDIKKLIEQDSLWQGEGDDISPRISQMLKELRRAGLISRNEAGGYEVIQPSEPDDAAPVLEEGQQTES